MVMRAREATARLYVVSYDIGKNKSRNRLSKYLKGHGFRVNRSVFEASFTPAQLEKFLAFAQGVVGKGDSLLLYPITERIVEERISLYGKGGRRKEIEETQTAEAGGLVIL